MSGKKPRIVGIDGLARAGKGTVAGAAAKYLGWSHFDVGSSFRTFTYLLNEKGVTPNSFKPSMLKDYELDFTPKGAQVNGMILGDEIRSSEIGALTADYCNHAKGFKPKIFERLTDIFQNYAGDLIADGRNLRQLAPNSLLVYVTADSRTRAKRAFEDEKVKNPSSSKTLSDILEETIIRDKDDFSNKETPLMHNKEAKKSTPFRYHINEDKELVTIQNKTATGPYNHFIDTSNMDPEEQLDILVDIIKNHYNLK